MNVLWMKNIRIASSNMKPSLISSYYTSPVLGKNKDKNWRRVNSALTAVEIYLMNIVTRKANRYHEPPIFFTDSMKMKKHRLRTLFVWFLYEWFCMSTFELFAWHSHLFRWETVNIFSTIIFSQSLLLIRLAFSSLYTYVNCILYKYVEHNLGTSTSFYCCIHSIWLKSIQKKNVLSVEQWAYSYFYLFVFILSQNWISYHLFIV